MSRYEEFHRLRWFEWPHAALQLCGAGPRIRWAMKFLWSCGSLVSFSGVLWTLNQRTFPQDTDTFLVLGSPAILTRKWCVGEMVTVAQLQVMAPQPDEGLDVGDFRLVCRHMLWQDANALSPHFVFVFVWIVFRIKVRVAASTSLATNSTWSTQTWYATRRCSQRSSKNTRSNTSSREILTCYHHPFMFIHPLEVLMLWDSVHGVPLVSVCPSAASCMSPAPGTAE